MLEVYHFAAFIPSVRVTGKTESDLGIAEQLCVELAVKCVRDKRLLVDFGREYTDYGLQGPCVATVPACKSYSAILFFEPKVRQTLQNQLDRLIKLWAGETIMGKGLKDAEGNLATRVGNINITKGMGYPGEILPNCTACARMRIEKRNGRQLSQWVNCATLREATSEGYKVLAGVKSDKIDRDGYLVGMTIKPFENLKAREVSSDNHIRP